MALFFLFPIVWVFLMSFQTNEQILRIPPSMFFEPTLSNYAALISGKLQTAAGTLEIAFMNNLKNSVILSTVSVALALVLGVPAAYAFARFKFRLGENIAFTLLSFRFAPPLLVLLLPSALLPPARPDRHLGRADLGLPADRAAADLVDRARLFRGHQPGHRARLPHRRPPWRTFTRIALPLALPGIAAAGLLAFIFCWNNFVFALILASADKQPVTVGALAFVTASGIQYGQIAAAVILSITPTLLLASTPSATWSRACRSAR